MEASVKAQVNDIFLRSNFRKEDAGFISELLDELDQKQETSVMSTVLCRVSRRNFYPWQCKKCLHSGAMETFFKAARGKKDKAWPCNSMVDMTL